MHTLRRRESIQQQRVKRAYPVRAVDLEAAGAIGHAQVVAQVVSNEVLKENLGKQGSNVSKMSSKI